MQSEEHIRSSKLGQSLKLPFLFYEILFCIIQKEGSCVEGNKGGHGRSLIWIKTIFFSGLFFRSSICCAQDG